MTLYMQLGFVCDGVSLVSTCRVLPCFKYGFLVMQNLRIS